MKDPPPGVSVDANAIYQNLSLYVIHYYDFQDNISPLTYVSNGFVFIAYKYRWNVHMKGADGTLYQGEDFQLQFRFSSKYPFDSPEVCKG